MTDEVSECCCSNLEKQDDKQQMLDIAHTLCSPWSPSTWEGPFAMLRKSAGLPSQQLQMLRKHHLDRWKEGGKEEDRVPGLSAVLLLHATREFILLVNAMLTTTLLTMLCLLMLFCLLKAPPIIVETLNDKWNVVCVHRCVCLCVVCVDNETS